MKSLNKKKIYFSGDQALTNSLDIPCLYCDVGIFRNCVFVCSCKPWIPYSPEQRGSKICFLGFSCGIGSFYICNKFCFVIHCSNKSRILWYLRWDFIFMVKKSCAICWATFCDSVLSDSQQCLLQTTIEIENIFFIFVLVILYSKFIGSIIV